MTNTKVHKYLNSLPNFFRKKTHNNGEVDDFTNYKVWQMGLGPNKWHY